MQVCRNMQERISIFIVDQFDLDEEAIKLIQLSQEVPRRK